MVQKYMKSHWVSLVFGEVKIKPKFHTQQGGDSKKNSKKQGCRPTRILSVLSASCRTGWL